MQLPVAEDLLRNTENLAIVIGDVLEVTSENISDSNTTIIGDNIGMPNTHNYVHAYTVSCSYNNINIKGAMRCLRSHVIFCVT